MNPTTTTPAATPRTDGVADLAGNVHNDYVCSRSYPASHPEVVPADFARTLERSLAAAQERIKELEGNLRAVQSKEALRLDELQAMQKAQTTLAAERDALREKNKALHRRAQQAESIVDMSGVVEGRPQGAKNRSFGRALANYAAAKYQRERDEALAELDALRKQVEQLGGC